MELLLFSTLSVTVFGIGAWLFRIAAGSLVLAKLNIVSWVFYYHLTLLCFLGINLGVFGVPHYIMSRTSSESLYLAYFAVCYVFILMPLSMVVYQRLVARRSARSKLLHFYDSVLTPLQSRLDSSQLVFWLVMTAVTLLATVYVYYITRSLPFLALLNDSDAYASLRQDAGRRFGGNVYVRNFLALILSQITSYVVLAYTVLRKSFLFKLWFAVTFLIVVLAVTYSGEKAPIISYIIGCFFVAGVARGGFKKRYLVTVGAIVAAVIIYIYASAGQLSLTLNSGPIGRILMTQISGLPMYFDYFPAQGPFLKGASFPAWFSSLLGLEHIRPARIIMTYANPVAVAEGRAGVINTLFIGEAWANFGWWGFFISPIIVGTVVQAIHNLLISLPRSPIYIAVMVYFMLRVPITGGFVDFLWNSGWFFLFLLLSSSLFARPLLMGAKRSSLEAQ